MRLEHEGSTIASTVEVADSTLARARGLMFRRSIPSDYALVFRFGDAARRDVHMVFVPFPIDAVWVIGGRVERVDRLRPWIGFASARADTLVELPAGSADGVERGDRLQLEG